MEELEGGPGGGSRPAPPITRGVKIWCPRGRWKRRGPRQGRERWAGAAPAGFGLWRRLESEKPFPSKTAGFPPA